MTDKIVPIVHDYAAIAQGLKEIEARKGWKESNREPEKLVVGIDPGVTAGIFFTGPRCKICNDVGWLVSYSFSTLASTWQVCPGCHNPQGKSRPP